MPGNKFQCNIDLQKFDSTFSFLYLFCFLFSLDPLWELGFSEKHVPFG
uniref:Uncharacterized protein n=1 Tax=Rhizophora mucronata TaxID=61149 RepID=A0A2P2MXH9_RHIMU